MYLSYESIMANRDRLPQQLKVNMGRNKPLTQSTQTVSFFLMRIDDNHKDTE